MGKINLLIKYLVYRIRRKGAKGHGIHSPFVYTLNRDVLNSRKKYPEYLNIKKFRYLLTKNSQKIEVNDRGAGSVVFTSNNRKIKDIVNAAGSSYRMGKLLFRLARHIRPGTIIELGTSVGFGTFCLSEGVHGSRIYSIDACASQLGIASDGLNKAGIGNVELIEGSFDIELPLLLKRLDKLDLVYFDGDHRKDALLWQFMQCKQKAHPGSVFIVADINWSAGMNAAWLDICRDPDVSLSIDMFFCGLIFFRSEMAKQHFILSFS